MYQLSSAFVHEIDEEANRCKDAVGAVHMALLRAKSEVVRLEGLLKRLDDVQVHLEGLRRVGARQGAAAASPTP